MFQAITHYNTQYKSNIFQLNLIAVGARLFLSLFSRFSLSLSHREPLFFRNPFPLPRMSSFVLLLLHLCCFIYQKAGENKKEMHRTCAGMSLNLMRIYHGNVIKIEMYSSLGGEDKKDDRCHVFKGRLIVLNRIWNWYVREWARKRRGKMKCKVVPFEFKHHFSAQLL